MPPLGRGGEEPAPHAEQRAHGAAALGCPRSARAVKSSRRTPDSVRPLGIRALAGHVVTDPGPAGERPDEALRP